MDRRHHFYAAFRHGWQVEWQTKRLQEIETERNEWTVFVRPELVVEIAFNDLQKSPHYPGGLALRFARLKSYREDKGPEDADTIATVRSIYRWQGEVASDDEALLLIKSTASRYGELESAIAQHHPYDVPEIVQVPITAGVPSYLAWVQEMVKAQ